MPIQNRSIVGLRPDGKAALDRLAALLAPNLIATRGHRISFADAIIEAERICRKALESDASLTDDEPAQFMELR